MRGRLLRRNRPPSCQFKSGLESVVPFAPSGYLDLKPDSRRGLEAPSRFPRVTVEILRFLLSSPGKLMFELVHPILRGLFTASKSTDIGQQIILASAESSLRTSRPCSTPEPAHRQESERHEAGVKVNPRTNDVDLNHGGSHMRSQVAIISCI